VRAKDILLTALAVLMLLGTAVAVPHGSLQEDTVARYKDLYQPEEYNFLNSLGEPDEDEETGIDFGEEEEDWGIDFGEDE